MFDQDLCVRVAFSLGDRRLRFISNDRIRAWIELHNLPRKRRLYSLYLGNASHLENPKTVTAPLLS